MMCRPKGLADDAHIVINTYDCECGENWDDRWDSACDDECGGCGATLEPHETVDDPDCDCADCEARNA